MEHLQIKKTKSTPQVDFNGNGMLTISGRSFSEDPRLFFNPLIEWVRNLSVNTVTLEIRMDYLNTSSTKMMNELIKTIDANSRVADKVINWYFEDDDEDMIEVGQIIEENTFSTSFFFYEMAASI